MDPLRLVKAIEKWFSNPPEDKIIQFLIYFSSHAAFAIAFVFGYAVKIILAIISRFGFALSKTGIEVNSDSSRMCRGELEHIPDIAAGL